VPGIAGAAGAGPRVAADCLALARLVALHIVLDDCWLDFESRLERNAALAFLARPDTAHLVEQTPRIGYRDDDGEYREHVFDLQVTKTDRTKWAIFVKPSELVRPAHKRMLHLIAEQTSPQVIQKILIVTEKKLRRADLYNAELIQEVRRDPDPADDKKIAGLIGAMARPVKIDDLVKASELDGSGFRAVVRAIAAGRMRAHQARHDRPLRLG
jgi:hypothetical protein